MFRPFFLVFFLLLLVENWNFLTRQISIHHRAQEFSFNVYHSHQIEFSLTGFSDFFSPLTNTKLYISSIRFWRCLYLSWDTAVLEREASQKKIYFFPSSLCKQSESFSEKKRTLFLAWRVFMEFAVFDSGIVGRLKCDGKFPPSTRSSHG